VGIIDTITSALGDEESTKRIEQEKYDKEQAKYQAKQSEYVAREKNIATSGAPDELKQKWSERSKEKYEHDQRTPLENLAKTKPVQYLGKNAVKAGAGVKETLRRNFNPTAQEKASAQAANDAAMARKIKVAEDAKRLRDAQPRPYNPPGRPASKAKQGRGEFTAPSYRPGKGYGGGFDINMGNMMGGIAPQRGSRPDPFGGLRGGTGMRRPSGTPPSFGDPFAGLGQRPKPKPAPVAAPKKKKKSNDVVIRISRNPMIKGLGAVVGLPGGRKPRGRNPFEF